MNQKSSILVHAYESTASILMLMSILLIMNQIQAHSCLCPRIKHTHAYDSKPSILMLVSQKRYLPTTKEAAFHSKTEVTLESTNSNELFSKMKETVCGVFSKI